jgi:RNase adapter protein RapZ
MAPVSSEPVVVTAEEQEVAESSEDVTGPEPSLRLVVVTGMSGAGRSTAANALEDLGWYVVDNLPPTVLPEVCTQARQNGIHRLAVVLDVRTRSFFEQLPSMFTELTAVGTMPEILFLEAADDVIVRRQESYGAAADDALRVTVVSFGFKNGIPVDADLVVDVRFLPNPHWVPELRPQTGLSQPVRDYVLAQDGAEEFLQRLQGLLQVTAKGYITEGKRFATIAIGCTGGKHRSTAMAEEFGRRLREAGMATKVLHRDVGRE